MKKTPQPPLAKAIPIPQNLNPPKPPLKKGQWIEKRSQEDG